MIICIRIKDFKGITPSGTTRIETSPYFEGYNVKYSIQVQGRFKENNLTADDIDFGIFKDDKWLPSWPSSNGEHIEEDVNCPNNQIWYFDFSNSVTDFNDLTVKLGDLQPACSLCV
ncbi:unnamed protein product [Rhizophagus irregularis]|nr:unnamed protein product [Rhizophagus irregularis]